MSPLPPCSQWQALPCSRCRSLWSQGRSSLQRPLRSLSMSSKRRSFDTCTLCKRQREMRDRASTSMRIVLLAADRLGRLARFVGPIFGENAQRHVPVDIDETGCLERLHDRRRRHAGCDRVPVVAHQLCHVAMARHQGRYYRYEPPKISLQQGARYGPLRLRDLKEAQSAARLQHPEELDKCQVEIADVA